ncbi:hypothetical protein BDZ89DRAFT_958050 [Hymenopellis radicata]|nr:hypothetical protein BDZ89DRAFT_958050 [Hymenopellis radicata]
MGKILLACLVGSSIPERGVTACRAILDFIYLAQYSTHDDDTLGYMDAALDTWHANKDYFIQVGLRSHFNFPKLHSLRHYVQSIRYFGATNNFNTEMFERLHIDFSKKGWRASNKRDEYPQMTTWVIRKENVHAFKRYTTWVQKKLELKPSSTPSDSTPLPTTSSIPPAVRSGRLQQVSLPKHPSIVNKPIRRIASQHHVRHFAAHLLAYLLAVGRDALGDAAQNYSTLPFDGLDVYYSFKFAREGLGDDFDVRDVVKASPQDGGHFDTVVVLTGDEAESAGLEGTRIGRVRVIFRIPAAIKLHGILVKTPNHWPRHPLAYVEWYTKPVLSAKAARTHLLPSVSKAYLADRTTRAWSIVPLTNIRQSAHLSPDFSKCGEEEWDIPVTKSSVLDTCSHFVVNNWLSLYTYQTIYLA